MLDQSFMTMIVFYIKLGVLLEIMIKEVLKYFLLDKLIVRMKNK